MPPPPPSPTETSKEGRWRGAARRSCSCCSFCRSALHQEVRRAAWESRLYLTYLRNVSVSRHAILPSPSLPPPPHPPTHPPPPLPLPSPTRPTPSSLTSFLPGRALFGHLYCLSLRGGGTAEEAGAFKRFFREVGPGCARFASLTCCHLFFCKVRGAELGFDVAPGKLAFCCCCS